MQVNSNITDKYYTPYKTNTNVKYISGFSLNTDGEMEFGEVSEVTEGKGFISEFVDYQKFYKEWMSQGTTTAFCYTVNKGLNVKENSISLVPGVTIRLANGFQLAINNYMVSALGDFKNNAASSESAAIAGALNSLIKVANGQIPMNFFYNKHQNNSEYAKIGLQAAGIDTSKTFIINEKKFHFDDEGQIRLGEKENE